MRTAVQRWQSILLLNLMTLATAACAASTIESIVIHPEAKDVQRHSVSESTSKQISYRVQLEYPETAVSDAAFKQLAELGWVQCIGRQKGWDSYVDASSGVDDSKAVFQNMFYWKKGETLITIVMRYYGNVGAGGRKPDSPGNDEQYVVIVEDHNPDTAVWLQVACL